MMESLLPPSTARGAQQRVGPRVGFVVAVGGAARHRAIAAATAAAAAAATATATAVGTNRALQQARAVVHVLLVVERSLLRRT